MTEQEGEGGRVLPSHRLMVMSYLMRSHFQEEVTVTEQEGGVRVLPSHRLMVMCCLMRSHFQGWIDYYGYLHFLKSYQNEIAHSQDF